MKNINLPFQIGEQYEKWEFDLEILAADRIRGKDSYYYTKNISFYGLKPAKTELIFGLDVLEAVILSFELLEISYILRKTLFMPCRYWSAQNLDTSPNIVIYIIEFNKAVHILYGKKPIVVRVLSKLRHVK